MCLHQIYSSKFCFYKGSRKGRGVRTLYNDHPTPPHLLESPLTYLLVERFAGTFRRLCRLLEPQWLFLCPDAVCFGNLVLSSKLGLRQRVFGPFHQCPLLVVFKRVLYGCGAVHFHIRFDVTGCWASTLWVVGAWYWRVSVLFVDRVFIRLGLRIRGVIHSTAVYGFSAPFGSSYEDKASTYWYLYCMVLKGKCNDF